MTRPTEKRHVSNGQRSDDRNSNFQNKRRIFVDNKKSLSERFQSVSEERRKNMISRKRDRFSVPEKMPMKRDLRPRGSNSNFHGRGNFRGSSSASRSKNLSRISRNNKMPLDKEKLDADLDKYMMKNENFAKAKLDEELDNYMAMDEKE
ncbi:hypothetical protein ROZALSC1DRAFT_27490 [Rozella allomycis CSF55]|uniref:Chromatin target of PRMT1 protein C-terminal domain-containing protein n=1 Tax=Rozella allomycis (strain CSF55) TaxID=988480 RepID=A0A075AMY7_ROZAC|nr:hypothetical protein O9G_004650 [Rozella allomycis CSF55]RKP21067.1 hypothetical protein ROZALSC1DRAFT_27490 [Rozella allomycis CSF55]|eukprot:EPZ31076.1 hypothetical protein O9G_004650 [Rozella allomycis CSF55]